VILELEAVLMCFRLSWLTKLSIPAISSQCHLWSVLQKKFISLDLL